MLTRRQFLGILGALAYGPPAFARPALAQRPAFLRMALASLTFDFRVADRLAVSLAKILGVIETASAEGAALVVLPEMALGGLQYGMTTPGIETAWWTTPGLSARNNLALAAIQAQASASAVDVFFGAAEFTQDGLYNSAYLATRTGHLSVVSRKIAEHAEVLGAKCFSSGTVQDAVREVSLNGLRIATLVCSSLLTPGIQARVAALSPDLVLVLANWWEDAYTTRGFFQQLAEQLSVPGRLAVFNNFAFAGRDAPTIIAQDGLTQFIYRPQTDSINVLEANLSTGELTRLNELILQP